MPDIQDTEERLLQLLERGDARIARIFNTAITQLRNSLNLDELATLIEQSRYDEALKLIQDTATQLGNGAQLTFIDAGVGAAAFLTAADVGHVVFDVVNVRALQAMQAQQLDIIRGFTADQQLTVHEVLMNGIREGLNPRAMARNFRDVVGLTDHQAQAVLNFRRLLEQAGNNEFTAGQQREALTRALRDGRFDRSVVAAVNNSRPLSQVQIDRMVTRYSERYVKYRAEVIGRTQALRAVNEGTEEAYNQAIEAGKIDAANLVRSWSTTMDGRERLTHALLNGQQRGWGETWTTINGEIRYPGDPSAPAEEIINCRCLLTTRIKVQ